EQKGGGRLTGSAEISDKNKSLMVVWRDVRRDPPGWSGVSAGTITLARKAAEFTDAEGVGKIADVAHEGSAGDKGHVRWGEAGQAASAGRWGRSPAGPRGGRPAGPAPPRASPAGGPVADAWSRASGSSAAAAGRRARPASPPAGRAASGRPTPTPRGTRPASS